MSRLRIAVTPRFGTSTNCATLRSTATLTTVGLFAAQALLLDQEVDHVERGVARGEADVLGEIGERRDLLAAQIGVKRRQLAFRLQRQTA
jgi:hypothetical protein